MQCITTQGMFAILSYAEQNLTLFRMEAVGGGDVGEQKGLPYQFLSCNLYKCKN